MLLIANGCADYDRDVVKLMHTGRGFNNKCSSPHQSPRLYNTLRLCLYTCLECITAQAISSSISLTQHTNRSHHLKRRLICYAVAAVAAAVAGAAAAETVFHGELCLWKTGQDDGPGGCAHYLTTTESCISSPLSAHHCLWKFNLTNHHRQLNPKPRRTAP